MNVLVFFRLQLVALGQYLKFFAMSESPISR